MTELDVLINISNSLTRIAAELGGIGTILCLMLFFKNMGGKQ